MTPVRLKPAATRSPAKHSTTVLPLRPGKCSKISNTFLFLFENKMLVIMVGIHKMYVRIANMEDPGQTACGSLLFV